MDRLWTPWRYAYVTKASGDERKGVPEALAAWPAGEDRHCVFCNLLAATDWAIANSMPAELAEKAAHILTRGPACFVCLNAFPYSSGHVLIVPYQHTASLADLPEATAAEMIRHAQAIETALRETYRPDGLNFGLNLGEAAGAGVAQHVHMHGLPRWAGDTSFITVVAETRILPEILDVTWDRLRNALNKT